MNSPRYLQTMAASLCAMALLCAAAATSADTIYKQVDPDGRTTYSDQPDPAATPARSTSARKARSAAINAKEAARRLDKAQLQREQGSQPLPGELAKGGAGAVNHRYWQRQEKMRRVVEDAQRRANETQERLLLARR